MASTAHATPARPRAEVAEVAVAPYAYAADRPEVQEAHAACLAPFGLTAPPFISARLSFELRLRTPDGAPSRLGVSLASALRRALYEGRGRCLTFDLEDYVVAEATEPLIAPEFLRVLVRQIPLSPTAPDDPPPRFRLAVANVGRGGLPGVRRVCAGDLEPVPPFAGAPATVVPPQTLLCLLQPGHTVEVRDVRVEAGYGRDDGAFYNFFQCALVPLDLAEHPREETHAFPVVPPPESAPAPPPTGPGSRAYQSGYVESTLTARPCHFRIAGSVAAVPARHARSATLGVAVRSFEEVAARFRDLRRFLDDARAAAAAGEGGEAAPGAAARGATFDRGSFSLALSEKQFTYPAAAVSAPGRGQEGSDSVVGAAEGGAKGRSPHLDDREAAPADGRGAAGAATVAGETVTLSGARLELVLGGETDTVGALVSDAVFHLRPDVAYVAYRRVYYENCIRFELEGVFAEPEEAVDLTLEAVRLCEALVADVVEAFRRA